MSVKVTAGLSGFVPVVASGGTVTDVNVGGTAFRVHTFLTSGDFVVESAGSTGEVEYLVVAGGGGGGKSGGAGAGGGGGAGGYLTSTASVTSATYPVVVGQGGVGATTANLGGSNGSDSTFAGLTAVGGGGGGGHPLVGTGPFSGGSGGGSGTNASGNPVGGASGTVGQGNDGGDGSSTNANSGGGGGAGSVGVAATSTAGGDGGAGLSNAISGTSVDYAGGGGGGSHASNNPGSATAGGGAGGGTSSSGVAGTDGRGGGGGGAGGSGNGADGGDGVVILRYPLTTDVTGSTVSVSVRRGREDETEAFQTGRANLTLRNLDGTFDPLGTPFRLRDEVTVSWEGNGTAVPVFTGFVEDVTLGYDLSGDAQVQVSCVDGFALLANQTIVTEAVPEEDSGARITNILANTGVSWSAGTAIDTGISILAAGTADGNALQYLRQAEESEQGYLYVSRDGTLTFLNRHTTLNNPIAGTQFSDDGSGIPYQAVERFSGARSLFNKVTGELEDGTAREANDLTSQAEFSIRTLDLGEVLLAETLVLEDFVQYLLAQFAEPATRVDRLTVNLERLSYSDAEDIVSFEIADICDVEFTPPGRSPFTDELLVQGIRHDVTVGGPWRTTFSFQRRDTRSFLILDDAVQGKMDDINVLAF